MYVCISAGFSWRIRISRGRFLQHRLDFSSRPRAWFTWNKCHGVDIFRRGVVRDPILVSLALYHQSRTRPARGRAILRRFLRPLPPPPSPWHPLSTFTSTNLSDSCETLNSAVIIEYRFKFLWIVLEIFFCKRTPSFCENNFLAFSYIFFSRECTIFNVVKLFTDTYGYDNFILYWKLH